MHKALKADGAVELRLRTVALREIPAAQCTRTRPLLRRTSSM